MAHGAHWGTRVQSQKIKRKVRVAKLGVAMPMPSLFGTTMASLVLNILAGKPGTHLYYCIDNIPHNMSNIILIICQHFTYIMFIFISP